MAFKPRPPRPATGVTILSRRIARAVHDPHDSRERFDPDFILALRCSACGKDGLAPRRHIQAAVEEHAASCPRRHEVSAVAVRVFYPKQ